MNVITWNMQGATGQNESKWNTDVKRLFTQANADVVCVQECGALPQTSVHVPVPPPFMPLHGIPGTVPGAYNTYNLGTQSRPAIIYIFWVMSDPTGNRCNLAIASKIQPTGLIYVANGMGGRPSIGMRVPTGGGAIDVFTVHAFSPGGNDAPGLLNAVHGTGSPAWFLAGDFNRAPATWAGVALPAGTAPCGHNAVATHPGTGTNLDYAFKSAGPAVLGAVGNNFVVSDHFPVAYVI